MYAGRGRESSRDARHAGSDARQDLVRDRAGGPRDLLDRNRELAAAPEDQLLLPMQGVIAEYEREKILERYRRGKLHKAHQGHVSVLSGAPSGYGYIPATATDAARYEILDREARIVKRVFHLLVNDHQSIGAIARLLTTEQIPTRRDVGKWERAVVWARVRNPAYTGQAA